MKRHYTRVCNFYYGKESKQLVNKKKSLPKNTNKLEKFAKLKTKPQGEI